MMVFSGTGKLIFGIGAPLLAVAMMTGPAAAGKGGNNDHHPRIDVISAPRHAGTAGIASLLSSSGRHANRVEARIAHLHTRKENIDGVDFYGDGLLNIAVAGKAATAGSVALTPAAADKAIFSAINMDGVTEAQSLTSRNGEVTLAATPPTPDPATLTNITFDEPGRPIISYADAVIEQNAPFETLPYFNPVNPLATGTNMSIKWNPEAGRLPQAANKMTAISPQAGKGIASTLTNIEPAAGGNGGQSGDSALDCVNNFLDDRVCTPPQ